MHADWQARGDSQVVFTFQHRAVREILKIGHFSVNFSDFYLIIFLSMFLALFIQLCGVANIHHYSPSPRDRLRIINLNAIE